LNAFRAVTASLIPGSSYGLATKEEAVANLLPPGSAARGTNGSDPETNPVNARAAKQSKTDRRVEVEVTGAS
jgi:hypothetical protein